MIRKSLEDTVNMDIEFYLLACFHCNYVNKTRLLIYTICRDVFDKMCCQLLIASNFFGVIFLSTRTTISVHYKKPFRVLVVWRKGKGSCLESRFHDSACSTHFASFLARWAPVQLVAIDPTLKAWICAPGTHYGWVDRDSVAYEVAQHFYTWPALRIEPQTFWPWVQPPIST